MHIIINDRFVLIVVLVALLTSEVTQHHLPEHVEPTPQTWAVPFTGQAPQDRSWDPGDKLWVPGSIYAGPAAEAFVFRL